VFIPAVPIIKLQEGSVLAHTTVTDLTGRLRIFQKLPNRHGPFQYQERESGLGSLYNYMIIPNSPSSSGPDADPRRRRRGRLRRFRCHRHRTNAAVGGGGIQVLCTSSKVRV
jgi:hypothetical protein